MLSVRVDRKGCSGRVEGENGWVLAVDFDERVESVRNKFDFDPIILIFVNYQCNR